MADMPSWESIGVALGTLATGWGLGRRKRVVETDPDERSMDPDDWHNWRRDVDARLMAAEKSLALGNQAIQSLADQLTALSKNVDKLLEQVIQLRIDLGQHPERDR